MTVSHNSDSSFSRLADRVFNGHIFPDVGLACILACLYFMALPLTIATNEAGSSFLRLITIPIAAFFLAALFFYREKLELNSVHLFLALFLLSCVATLYADSSSVAVMYVRGYIETVTLIFLISMRKYTRREEEIFDLSQLALLVIMIFLGFSTGSWYGGRNTMTIMGATSDPNYFTSFFFYPMAVAMKKIAERKNYAPLCFVLILLGAYSVLSSGSRGGLIAMAVIMASYMFIRAKSVLQRLCGIAGLIAAAALFWTVVLPLLPASVAERFSIQVLLESRGSARGDIWISMLKTIRESTWELFCGRGIFVHHEMMINGKLEQVVAHNHFIQTLYNQGIFGFLLFCLLSLSAIFRNLKQRPHVSAAMIGMLTLAMTLTINPSIKSFWNLLIFAAFSMAKANVENNKEGGSISNEKENRTV